MIHKIFTSALVLMLLISTQVFAQDVEFFASARNQVAVGERFMLSFKINADGKDFKGPNLKDFSVLGGPNPSHSSSFQFINGNMSKQVEVSYNYILVARKEGKYTIDPAKIKVDGKIYETDPIHITVTKGSSSLPSGNTKNKQSQGQKQGQEQGPPLAFLKVVADNTSPYIGEQVLVTYKLYFRTNISDYSLKKAPSYPGFWFEDLTDKLQPGVNSQEFVNNTKYTVVDLRKELLFPQKSGKIKSGPMEFEIVARIKEQGRRSRDPFFDDFFGNYKNIQRTLVTDPIEFNVKTLPLAGKPAHFQGAVGRFNVKASVDQKELKVNDAITYKIKVNGKGNLKLIQAPKLNLPPDFEVYDPKVKENYRTSVSSGVSGTKTFEYLIIPRTPGSFKIPEIEFAYFDINTKKYKVEKTQSFDINVSKGEGGSTSSVLYAGNGKEEIRYIGTDIRHIKEGEIKLYEKGYFIITSWSFFLLLIIGITLLVFVLWFVQWNDKRKGNFAELRNKRANKVVSKRLKTAREHLSNQKQEAFYEEISVALWGFISDKFNIPRAELSMENVTDKLKMANAKPEIIEQFIDTLNSCEFARFAPGDPSDNMKQIYDKAAVIIIQIEKELR